MPLSANRLARNGALLLGLLLPPATAAEPPPLTNHAALARSFALPVLGVPVVAPAGGSSTQAAFGLINEFELRGFTREPNGDLLCTAPAECQRLDGETYRLALRYRRGFAQGWEWNIEVPVLAQSGGFLDGAIETWHGWFGLPNGGREFVPRNEYVYFYRRNDDVLLDVTEPASGLGDIRLGLGWQVADGLALRGQLKLPTGDEARLTGGNAGGALWLDAGLPLTDALDAYFSAGASVAAHSSILSAQQNRLVVIGGSGLAYAWSPALSLHLQLYLHGRLYDDSDLRALRRNGAILGVGARYRLGTQSWLDIGFQEDLNVNVSPDFVVQMALTWNGS